MHANIARVSTSLFCPVCLTWDQITVDIVERRGRCTCGVLLLLEKNVWPAEAVAGYPEKMLGLTSAGDSLFKSWRRGDEHWFRPRGSWIAKAVSISPEHFEQRTRIGTRAVEPIANLRGFMPVQVIDWAETQYFASWRCCALVEAAVVPLYPFDDLDRAARASRELSETLWKLKPAGDPFRS